MRRLLAVIAIAIPLARGAEAHEVRPAYLDIRQSGTDSYDVMVLRSIHRLGTSRSKPRTNRR